MSTMTTKGQITILKSIRDLLDLAPGDEIDLFPVDKRVEILPSRKHTSLFGILSSRRPKSASMDDMYRAIEDHLLEKVTRAEGAVR